MANITKLNTGLPLEELYSILPIIPVDMAILDRDLHYVMVTDRWLKNHDLDGQNVIGKSHYAIFPDLPERWKLGHARCLQGASESCELDRYQRDDGEILWLRWSVRPWHNSEGEIGGICVFTEILNEQKKLEANLKKTKESYLFACRAGEVGVWDWDVSSNHVVWNEVIYDLLDVPQASFHGSLEDLIKCLHKDDVDRVHAEIKQAILGVEPFDSMYRIIRRDGSIRYIRSKAQANDLQDGCTVRMSGVCYDVTNQVETSQKLIAALDEQREAQKKLENYSAMLENALEGIAELDTEGKYVYVNEAYAAITGHGHHGLIGKSWEITVVAEDIPKMVQAFQHMLEHGKVTEEARGLRADGSIFHKRSILISRQNDEDKFDGYYCLIQDITSQKRTEDQLRLLAWFDTVTGLPNRTKFQLHLENILTDLKENPRSFAVLFIDLDKFKKVNDFYGHYQGDVFLRKIAESLQLITGEGLFLARLGGDEFVIIYDNLERVDQVREVAQRIVDMLSQPFFSEGREVVISASVGVTICDSDQVLAEDLIRRADMAMYVAKQNNGNQVQFYTEEIHGKNNQKLEVELQLRHALENDELSLVFQPQLEIDSDQVVGFEVLLRWRNHQLGVVSPELFILVAEETGLIHDLGNWVVKKSIATYVDWLERNMIQNAKVKFSINCSPYQLISTRIVEVFAENLRFYGLDGSCFVLEITETALMSNVELVRNTLAKLVELGVDIAIDDFGKGYSCLTHLNQFPISYLKIDRSFLLDVPTAVSNCGIVKSLIYLSKEMDLQVIAEGVETSEQRAFLRKHRCQFAQGIFYSKPLTTLEVEAYLAEAVT